jgi:hypothetical protein
MEKRRGAYGIWVGEPEGKRPFVKSRRMWEDNTKIGLQ